MSSDANFQLADAILKGDLALANDILEEHPELFNAVLVHPQTTDDTPAIILASSCGCAETVSRLIRMGADPETKYEPAGWNPLHIAAQRNHINVGQVLLQAGALVDSEDNRNAKPLQWALKYQYFEFAKLLLEFGADINIRWRDGYAYLHHEAKDGKNESLRFMLEHGADPNIRDQRFGAGSTPLHGAARHDRLNAATILLEFGADVNATNDDGRTPLDLAEQSKKGKVIDLLEGNGGKHGTH